MWNEFIGAVGLGLIWALMTCGVFLSYRVLGVSDLSCEGSITLGAATSACCITLGVNPFLSLALSFVCGMAAGYITGLLHTKLGIPALLSGILTMIALWSCNLRIMGKANISLLRLPTVYSLTAELVGIPKSYSVLLLTALFTALMFFIVYLFFGTELGSAIRATGSNARMASAQGVNTHRMLRLGLAISNGLIALAGGLIAQSQGFADIQMGTGAIIIGLASLIIGEVIMGRAAFSRALIGIVIGSVVYRLIIAAVLKLGMPANDLKLFTAITVALALSLPLLKGKLSALTERRTRGRGDNK